MVTPIASAMDRGDALSMMPKEARWPKDQSRYAKSARALVSVPSATARGVLHARTLMGCACGAGALGSNVEDAGLAINGQPLLHYFVVKRALC